MNIKEFFSWDRDHVLNSQVLGLDGAIDNPDALHYVNDIVSTPYEVFLNYIKGTVELPFVLSSDVPQFSSLDSATTKLCSLMASLPNNGLCFEEIGKILQPGRTEVVGANRKYGENHIKTAVMLGLAFSKDNLYYLSAVGSVFPLLIKYQQDQLLARMVLRNPLVFNVVHKLLIGEEVSLTNEISFLSESTVKRRKSNSLQLCQMISLNKDIPVQGYLNQLK